MVRSPPRSSAGHRRPRPPRRREKPRYPWKIHSHRAQNPHCNWKIHPHRRGLHSRDRRRSVLGHHSPCRKGPCLSSLAKPWPCRPSNRCPGPRALRGHRRALQAFLVPARHGRETLPASARPPGPSGQSAAGLAIPVRRAPAMLRVVLPGVPDICPIDLGELAVSIDVDIDVTPASCSCPRARPQRQSPPRTRTVLHRPYPGGYQ